MNVSGKRIFFHSFHLVFHCLSLYTMHTHTHKHTFSILRYHYRFFSLLVFDRENKKSRNITVKNFCFLYIGHVYAFMAVFFFNLILKLNKHICRIMFAHQAMMVLVLVVVTRLLESRALYCIHNFCLFGWIFWFIFFLFLCVVF